MRALMLAGFIAMGMGASVHSAEPVPLPNTEPLTMEGDIAAQLVAGVDKFLLRKIDESAATRDKLWSQVGKSEKEQQAFYTEQRKKLAHMLGVRDERVKFDAPTLIETARESALIAESDLYKIFAVRWPTCGDMFAEGLLIEPRAMDERAGDIIALPDADTTPEQCMGLVNGLAPRRQLARALAERRYRVLVPTLISREYQPRNGRAKMTHREYIYRPAFELGRHVIGYEVQAVLAAVDWFEHEGGGKANIGVVGSGEGGQLALYAAALDPRIDIAALDGYFGHKEQVWQQPLDRNLFGVLSQFGDAEVSRLVAGQLVIVNNNYPSVTLPSEGGAPGKLVRPTPTEWKTEVERALRKPSAGATRIFSDDGIDHTGKSAAEQQFQLLTFKDDKEIPSLGLYRKMRAPGDPRERQTRLLKAMDRHTQALLTESPYVRAEFMKQLDTSSPEKYAKSVEPYREKFKREVIGWFDEERLPPKPRSRKIIDKEKYTGYEVVLDVWPDVIAYGILLLPKDKDATPTKRPVVVCQHGLEGRPQDIVAGNHDAYHDFAAKLAERGFITFSPQNLYIGEDKFRTLQRKANPLDKTLFSIIIPQHQQIVAWLKTLPQVDGERIGFYGLSYGGKSAMRIPPLVPEYRLSICSADFNDWVWKNASTRTPYSYVWSKEYEIFEWDLGSTFNYSEMAALIAPRPFMVERGHFDGVAPDETVASEFAKVYHLYNARLKLGDRAQIEWFVGPHTINGQGTFRFLHKHLDWPEPKE